MGVSRFSSEAFNVLREHCYPFVNFVCLPRPQTPKVKKTPVTAFSSPTQTFRLWLCFLETLLVTTRFQRSLVIALTFQCTERAQYCPPATLKNYACL